MFPTVKKGAGAIVIDTTAEGKGDAYSRMWEEAVAGRSEFEPVFISWLDDPDQCWEDPDIADKDLFSDWLSCESMDDAKGAERYSSLLNLDDEEITILKNHILPKWTRKTIHHPRS